MTEASVDFLDLGDLPVAFVNGPQGLWNAQTALLVGLEGYVEGPHAASTLQGSEDGQLQKKEKEARTLLVGLDTEWRPENFRNENRTSILQVALDNQVFLFDLLNLCQSPCASELDALLLTLLTSPEAIKIGTDFVGDLLKLRQSYPHMRCFQKVEPYVELQAFHSSLRSSIMQSDFQSEVATAKGEERQRLYQMWHSSKGKKGLAWMVGHYLKKKLDKRQCMSDWARRPLNEAQISYAALDAHSQIDLYKEMTKMLRTEELPRGARPFALTSTSTVELDTVRFGESSESEKEGDLDEPPLPEVGAVAKISGCIIDIRFEGCSHAVPANTALEIEVNGRSYELETTDEQPSADTVRAVPSGGILVCGTRADFEGLEVGAEVRVLPKVGLPDYSSWEPASPSTSYSDGAQSVRVFGRTDSPSIEASAGASPAQTFVSPRLEESGVAPLDFCPPETSCPLWTPDSGARSASPTTPSRHPLKSELLSTPFTPPPRSLPPMLPPWQTRTPDGRDHVSRLLSPASPQEHLSATRRRKRDSADFATPSGERHGTTPRSMPTPFQPRHAARQLFSSAPQATTAVPENVVGKQGVLQFSLQPDYLTTAPQSQRPSQNWPVGMQERTQHRQTAEVLRHRTNAGKQSHF